MLGEIVAGLAGHSLALLADAGHMLTDAAALGFAIFASAMAARPAAGRWTFGYSRLEILAAQANGITLGLLAAGPCWAPGHAPARPPGGPGGPVPVVPRGAALVSPAPPLVLGRPPKGSRTVAGANP